MSAMSAVRSTCDVRLTDTAGHASTATTSALGEKVLLTGRFTQAAKREDGPL